MCNCKERISKEILSRNLYPGANRVSDMNIEIMSGLTFSRMEAVYPDVTSGKKKRPTGFNLFHSFCPWCGEPYKEAGVSEEHDALRNARVEVPKSMAKKMSDVPLIFMHEDGEDAFTITGGILHEFDTDTNSFIIYDGDEIDYFEYGSCGYRIMMKRPEFIKQMEAQK